MFFPLVLLRGGCAGHKTLGGPLHHAQNTGKGRRQERRAPQPNVGRTLCAGHTRPVKNPAVLCQAALAEGGRGPYLVDEQLVVHEVAHHHVARRVGHRNGQRRRLQRRLRGHAARPEHRHLPLLQRHGVTKVNLALPNTQALLGQVGCGGSQAPAERSKRGWRSAAFARCLRFRSRPGRPSARALRALPGTWR